MSSESWIGVKEVGTDKRLRSLQQTRGGVAVEAEVVSEAPWTIALSYDASGNVEYVGWAEPGTAKTASGWRIIKLTYDASGNVTDVQWADGDDAFDNVWNNRTTYSYS